MTTAGRNEPCPCGSGRKYKHCCLRALDADDSLRMRLRSAEGAIVPALFAYAAREFGAAFFGKAWDEFFLWGNVPDVIENSKEFGTTFDPFLVFTFVPDPAEDDVPEGWPTEPLAQHFLHRGIAPVPDAHREFMEQACASPASFFVVESAAPGRALDLKDILTGRRFRVLERVAHPAARRRDVHAGGDRRWRQHHDWRVPMGASPLVAHPRHRDAGAPASGSGCLAARDRRELGASSSPGREGDRQASGSGRERLEALLADFARRGASGRNAFDPDIAELRRKLGLD